MEPVHGLLPQAGPLLHGRRQRLQRPRRANEPDGRPAGTSGLGLSRGSTWLDAPWRGPGGAGIRAGPAAEDLAAMAGCRATRW
eukprot:4865300-Alexandrium_andersonii.AAC.1